MKYCDQCGAQLNDKAKFCSICGTPVAPAIEIPTVIRCKNCGESLEEGASFCANCGSRNDTPKTRQSSSSAPVEPTRIIPVTKGTDTIEYLQRVTSLEKSIYAQTQTINELQDHISSLGHPQEYSKPRHPGEYFDNILKGTWTALTSGTFLVGLLIWFFSKLAFWPSMLLGAFISVGIVIAFNLWECSSVNKQRDERYENELAYYTAAVKEDEMRVEAELTEKSSLIPIVNEMQDRLDETVQVLNQYYSKDIIFPKYRNLIAICSFYEYFMSGRCNTLTGHEGAYNIFENEVRLERICTKLDEVVERLEDIKSNQYVLYDAIQEGNRITERLVEESVRQSRIAERTAENTALAAHYAEIAANNAEACAWIGVANYISIQEGKR